MKTKRAQKGSRTIYQKRVVTSASHWLDNDGLKIYTISMSDKAVDREPFNKQLTSVKSARDVDWEKTPGFVIFHEGADRLYLVLCWWGNDNELFTSVSVLINAEWVEDSNRFSFCLFDLEVIWAERNFFIETVYCEVPNISRYRQKRLVKTNI